tara:strand:+ start:682 stop:1989 length:1308 start_codon:yes stop_codon:yes gene_type:complete
MATTNIELDIENMTGVSDADNQFIISAQKFVVASIPKNLLKWAGTETVASTHGGDDSPTSNNPVTLPVGTDNIISVRRGDNSVEEAPISDRAFLETTSGSLKIPTASFPKYYITAGNKIIVKPNPTDALTAHVTYVDFSKLDDDCDLRNAVVFRATSSEFTKLSSAQLPSSEISLYSVPPDTPNLATVYYSGPASDKDATSPTFTTATLSSASVYTGSAPTYSSPTVGSASESLTSSMTALTGDTYGTDADFLDFSKWFSVAGEFIEDEEDSELAAVQLNKISTYISSYSQAMQDKLNIFNTELQKYQVAVQESMQEIQVSNQVNIAQAQSDLQVSIGNEDRSQQRLLQNAVNEMQEIVNDNNVLLQKYQSDVSAFSAEVNKEIQEYQTKVQISQKYGMDAEKYYKWAQSEVTAYTQNNSKMIAAMMYSKGSQKE